MADFNPNRLVGMKMPICETFKFVLDEMVSNTQDLAQSLGIVQGRDRNNRYKVKYNFCIILTNKSPYVLSIGLINLIKKEITYIQVDYNHFSIKYCYCLCIIHLVWECMSILIMKKSKNKSRPLMSAIFAN